MMENRNYTNRGVAPHRHDTRIVSLTILPLGGYSTQYHRPFHAQVTPDTLNRFSRQFEGKSEYSSSAFVGMTRDFLSFGEKENEVPIVNGWGRERHRFMMETVTKNIMGMEYREFITGYTDMADGITSASAISVGREAGHVHVDPNMKFYINGNISMTETIKRGPRGSRVVRQMTNNMQVISNVNYDGYAANYESRLRPADVFYAMDSSNEIGRKIDKGLGGVYDTRQVSTDEAMLSRRSSVIPSFYVGKMFDGYSKTLYSDHSSHRDTLDSGSVYSQTANLLREDLALTDCFLDNLRQSMRLSRAPKTFQFRDLEKLDPDVARVVKGQVDGYTERTRVHRPGDTYDWDRPDYETSKALLIAHAIPAIMSYMSLMYIDVELDNENMGRAAYYDDQARPMFQIYELKALNRDDDDNVRHEKMYQALEWRIWNEVIRDVTQDGDLPFRIRVFCDLGGETVIHMHLDGDYREYVFPTFADSVATPLLTEVPDNVDGLANNFRSLLEHVVERDAHRNRDHLYIDEGYRNRREERSEDLRQGQQYHSEFEGTAASTDSGISYNPKF